MNNYEAVIILSATAAEEETVAFGEKMKALISSNGELTNVEEWGKRKLAYAIEDETEGYYVLMHFEASTDVPAELQRRLNITDGVLRSLITVA